jgi:hypothetical protein
MSSARTAYSQRPDVRAEAEVSVLASIYKLAISSHERKEAAAESRPDDAERSLSDGARYIIQEPK